MRLSIGCFGPQVKELQTRLNYYPPTKLPPLNADGNFGPKTMARVQEYQRNTGLLPDGIVGPLTWGKLNSTANLESPPEYTRPHCGDCDPANQGLALLIEQEFQQFIGLTGGQDTPYVSALSLPVFSKMSPDQEMAARGCFGDSLDYSRIYLSNKTGAQNRPFTVFVPRVDGVIQVMNVGQNPDGDTLLHELTHVWQSQHHSNKGRYLLNAVNGMKQAAVENVKAAVTDPIVTLNHLFPTDHPFSSYAYKLGKSFGEYGADQIAQQVMRNVGGIRAHVRSVAAGAVDADNVTSLATTRIEDRRANDVVR